MKRHNPLTVTAFALIGIGQLVGLAPAVASDLQNNSYDCLIEPKMTVLVGAPTQGVISSIDVERNEAVVPGQLLATLRSEVERASMEHARTRARMQSEIQSRQADLKLASVNTKRIQELYQKQMVPSQQRDEAMAQLEVARMAVKQAKDNQTLYEYEFSRAKQVLEQHKIRSPIAGVVVEQRAFPGEFVYQNPVVTVAQIDPLVVEAILPARFYGSVSAGMDALIAPEIDHSGPISIKVTATDKLIDAASGTFSVHLELPNPDNLIPGGQRCTVTFSEDSGSDQLAAANRRSGAH